MEKELSKEEYLRILNAAIKYGRSINDKPSADHYLEGAKAEALHSQQLVETLEYKDIKTDGYPPEFDVVEVWIEEREMPFQARWVNNGLGLQWCSESSEVLDNIDKIRYWRPIRLDSPNAIPISSSQDKEERLPLFADLIYEQDLPEMTDGEYSEWYKKSHIVDGVRMGPPFPKQESDEKISPKEIHLMWEFYWKNLSLAYRQISHEFSMKEGYIAAINNLKKSYKLTKRI